MKKFIAMLTLLIGFNANAGLLTIDISADEVSVGESVLVTISASNFDETDMFWFDFNFDNSVVSYDASSLSSGLTLADDNINFNGLEVSAEDFGLAFNFFTDDFSIRAAGDFVLASFNLIAGSEGFTDFSIANFFNPSAFDDYTIAFSGASSVNVSSAVAVSEPSAVFMMMLAGFALVSSRRKAK
ncbi:hypothetical protein CMT41_14555 [Colwellia sp. MT41]|uniref:PEP-CTERM protein-sorting domain-containing protein n=1 Tax=Colwellia marinimaniae TaxID=1513592 RepID=A0ABQ0MQW0_9GAMM|nr:MULTISPECIES: PEP-CTERM sorting domain-containing protein [Colwellia]ALO35803.1 hypothetical protein CMT41_14555 [Colwellia sp. MT41]GAW94719.1 hypothetical protein MTCD1_00316 [Colwellia marinimaniae]